MKRRVQIFQVSVSFWYDKSYSYVVRQATGSKSSLSRANKRERRKHSSDKFSGVSAKSSARGLPKSRKKTRDFRNVKIAMKSPYIQKRTNLSIKQAKLMSYIVKQKLSREKFMYILDKVPQTPKRAQLIDLLYTPKNYMRSNTKMSIQTNLEGPNKQSLPDIGEDLDISNEVKKIMQEYGDLQRKAVERKVTSNYLDSFKSTDLRSLSKHILAVHKYIYNS